MPTSETHIDYVAEPRLQQAQAMLDLFEADRQRAAVTLEELREWANAQNEDHLSFRVNQYLEYESVIRRMASRARPASPRIPPVLEWCANGAVAQRNVALDAAALALEVETATLIRQAGAISDNTTSDADQLERSYRGASSRRSMRNGRSSRSAFVSSSISRPPKRYDSARADGRASQQDLP
jgi:hypothetical protein